ncbi:ABC transporter substrate-binding protein [Thiococcus pfennigii]|uniref:ABC transporter substrate-binding protein n=1 Tax=Thiococcus pfennigii TaxID=1057 RepID=UPI0019059327|nr:ABC transporter substrate-binding protein [Thiococcus pfennigii]MBK1700484.1 hypothetical protein [Thiococcus pfennigii]
MKKPVLPRLAVAAFAGAILVATIAFWASLNKIDSDPTPDPIKVGFVEVGISGLMVELIKESALYQNSAVRVSFTAFNSPIALNNALVAGQIDVALATGANTVAKMRETSHDVKYFFPNVLNSVSLLTEKTSGLSSIEDLEGKKIGWYGLQTSGGTGLFLILKDMGYSPLEDFSFIEAKPPTLPPMLTRGDVDAIIVFEPFVSRLLSTGRYNEVIGPFWKVWREKYDVPLELSGFAAYDQWLTEHTHEARQLVSMWIESVRIFKSNPEEALELNSRFTGIDTEEAIALATARFPAILVDSWRNIDLAIRDVQELLFRNDIYYFAQPEGVIRKIAPTDTP